MLLSAAAESAAHPHRSSQLKGSRVGVAILHGIGSQSSDFADPFIAAVRNKLRMRGCDPDHFEFEPVRWGAVLQREQDDLMSRMHEGGVLDWIALRMFVVHALADAVAYRRGGTRAWDSYHQIHWEVFDALRRLRERLPDPLAPLYCVAHSLGSVILSDHIWDEQRCRGFGRDPFTRCATLAGIATLGSNIPLFLLGLGRVECVRFPGSPAHLAVPVREAAQWLNFYDRDDVLGYPLRTLDPTFGDAVHEDVQVNSGTVLTSWNPLSHNAYWTDHTVTARVAERLAAVQEACESATVF